jgi:hypothetical protein
MTHEAPPPRNNAPKTRGRPFGPGNPGRPKGARHHATVMAEQLLSDDIEAVCAKVVKKARAGDMVAARLILDRVSPVRKGRAAPFALPEIKTTGDIVAAMAAVTKAMASGRLSPGEAGEVAGVVELMRKSIETNEIETRLAQLEQRMGTADDQRL